MANQLGKNEGWESIEDTLKKNKIPYTRNDITLYGFSITWAYEFKYVKDGQSRYAYEVNFRTEIDDYIIISYVFDAPVSLREIGALFRGEK